MLAGRCLCWIQWFVCIENRLFFFRTIPLSNGDKTECHRCWIYVLSWQKFQRKIEDHTFKFWLADGYFQQLWGEAVPRKCLANTWSGLEPACIWIIPLQWATAKNKEERSNTLRSLGYSGARTPGLISILISVSSSFSNPLPKITADSRRNSSLHHTISMNSVKHVEHRCSNPSFSPVPLSLQSDRSDDKDNGLSWKLYHRLQWWFKAVAVYTCTHTGLLTFTSQKSTCSCPLVPFVSHLALFVSLFPFVCPCVSTQFHVSWAPSISWFSFRLHICVTYL